MINSKTKIKKIKNLKIQKIIIKSINIKNDYRVKKEFNFFTKIKDLLL